MATSYDAPSIVNGLKTRQLGKQLRFLKYCSSTNDVAYECARNGAAHGFTVISETQSQGRGRHGRNWISPQGGIWMTIILRLSVEAIRLEDLPLVGALSIAQSIRKQLNLDARVKWPNDVFVDARKVAGVIAECQLKGDSVEYALLGMGINANFDKGELKELQSTATTLMNLKRKAIDSVGLICAIILRIEELLGLDNCTILRILRNFDCSTGHKIRIICETETIEGEFRGYESLRTVQMKTLNRLRPVDTAAVAFVEYD